MSSLRAQPAALLAVLVPVFAAGFALVVVAAHSFVTTPRSATELVGIAAMFVVAAIAERYPVPVEGIDTRGVSLGFVFGVSSVVLFGWEAGTVVWVGALLVANTIDHRPFVRMQYNAATFALGTGAAGALIAFVDGDGPGELLARVVLAFSAQFSVNWLLVSLVVSVSARRPLKELLWHNLRSVIVPVGLMASAALMLVVLWQRSPAFSAALIGPLLAIALYQRSTYRAMRAMQLALTDPLTGLGNHRHFHERLQRELIDAEEHGRPLSLCLIDVDDFKQINDRFGHPVGDRVLAQIASRLRQGGEGFRLGGDEFAVLLPAFDGVQAHAAATSIVERVAALRVDEDVTATVSAGVATYPSPEVGRDELIRLADGALYWAKEHGKNQVRVYHPDVVELAELKRLASGPDRAARYRAAASLAQAVDARDAYTGSHSERVAELAARAAIQLGVDQEVVELTRLAARLHDLGKLAIPEELLRKPGPLTEPERLVLERHPQIGFRMLESLGVDPLADWVLHHHERWDGAGYPDGLAGEAIPLGARIIFVADAYDAMVSDRVYRERLSHEDALRELRRCAGSQFDPAVVDAFTAALGASDEVAVAS